MRQSTMVGVACGLAAAATIVGLFAWCGWWKGALLLLAVGVLTTTFAIMVDLREQEERVLQRWPSPDDLPR